MTTDVIESNNKPLTMVDLMAMVREILAESSARVEANLAESSARFEREYQKLVDAQAETNKQIAETDKIVKQNAKQLGGMGNSNGDFAQEFFFNALYNTKTLFGQVFDEVISDKKRKIKKTGVEIQYDVMLLNCVSACIVEVKYKADTDDVKKLFTKIEKLFRENFPEHAEKKLYLAMASMSFSTQVIKACKENGIAIIRPLGDTIEIYDDHLKVF